MTNRAKLAWATFLLGVIVAIIVTFTSGWQLGLIIFGSSFAAVIIEVVLFSIRTNNDVAAGIRPRGREWQ